jgi:hypothetical protein
MECRNATGEKSSDESAVVGAVNAQSRESRRSCVEGSTVVAACDGLAEAAA